MSGVEAKAEKASRREWWVHKELRHTVRTAEPPNMDYAGYVHVREVFPGDGSPDEARETLAQQASRIAELASQIAELEAANVSKHEVILAAQSLYARAEAERVQLRRQVRKLGGRHE